MIPKIIHYCWFGRNPKPQLLLKCIESWRKYCPDYEIIEWNESNFDVNQIQYTQDAYDDKKWAFVSDYARLKIVHDNGGIYLDTDVMLHGSIDHLLNYDCWLAQEEIRSIATGLGFGAIKGHRVIAAVMNEYKNYKYPNGTNVSRDTIVFEKVLVGWIKNFQNQIIDGTYVINCYEYAKFAKHLYAATWCDDLDQRLDTIEKNFDIKPTKWQELRWKINCKIKSPKIIQYFDKRKGTRLEKIYTFFAYDFLVAGPWYFIKRLFTKIFKRSK